MGIPDLTAYLSANPVFEASDLQFWFNKFIDPTISSNYAKFVTIKNGVGTPVDPSTAATAFGTQSILLKGKASDGSFFVNRGTIGAFTKTGTISDFTPAPSY
jgi:hypothetical protein